MIALYIYHFTLISLFDITILKLEVRAKVKAKVKSQGLSRGINIGILLVGESKSGKSTTLGTNFSGNGIISLISEDIFSYFNEHRFISYYLFLLYLAPTSYSYTFSLHLVPKPCSYTVLLPFKRCPYALFLKLRIYLDPYPIFHVDIYSHYPVVVMWE